jgi:succinate dehydrogenase hydrophobic anchor subunit
MSGKIAQILSAVILVVAFLGFFIFMHFLNKKAGK